MFKVLLLAVGKLKERYFYEACAEYKKRLAKYIEFSIDEIDDAKEPDNARQADIIKAVNKEGEAILLKLKKDDYVVSLCVDGQSVSSEELADFIKSSTGNISRLVFVIGGSNGLSEDVIKRADKKLSFSKFTFPHQLMRVILMEQIYRACKINNNERYHK